MVVAQNLCVLQILGYPREGQLEEMLSCPLEQAHFLFVCTWHVAEYFHTHGLSSHTHVMGGDPLIPSGAIASGHNNLPVNHIAGVGPDDTLITTGWTGATGASRLWTPMGWPRMRIARHLARWKVSVPHGHWFPLGVCICLGLLAQLSLTLLAVISLPDSCLHPSVS